MYTSSAINIMFNFQTSFSAYAKSKSWNCWSTFSIKTQEKIGTYFKTCFCFFI